MNDMSYTPEERNMLVVKVFEKTGIKLNTYDPVFALLALNAESNGQLLQAPTSAVNALTQSLSELKEGLAEAIDTATDSAILRLAECIEDGENTGEQVKTEITQFIDSALGSFDARAAKAIENNLQKVTTGLRWKQIGVTFIVTLALSAAIGFGCQLLIQTEQQDKIALYNIQNRALSALPQSVRNLYLAEFNKQLGH